jgi:hypothetical protein
VDDAWPFIGAGRPQAQLRERRTQHVGASATEHGFGGGVPGRDLSIRVDADDGLGKRVQQERGQAEEWL